MFIFVVHNFQYALITADFFCFMKNNVYLVYQQSEPLILVFTNLLFLSTMLILVLNLYCWWHIYWF